MSMPNIPNITPTVSLTRCETIDLLLSSIALEEIGLSHILNAEGEKLQSFLKQQDHCLDDYLKINHSVNQTLRTIVKSQMLLQFKLEDVADLDDHCECTCEKPKPKPKKAGCHNFHDQLRPEGNVHKHKDHEHHRDK
ncbi:hypothetical protein [Gracilibacillus alcaliphilus]|uniref:hypothetical protein n=1 Tax=Gracilibacillus alcaliphilus TaxID=1401441 RepID=UPI001EF87ECD|nr:hypothetical protein [Gracilibacillus alcaliphilus]MBM7676264.1 hypothetical protein [Gracilibacillus alcaliphilus]